MGIDIDSHHRPYKLKGPKRELAGSRPDVPLTLEAVSADDVEEKIHSYPPTKAGFDRFCHELVGSHDPHAIQVLFYLADNPTVAEYFECDTDLLFEYGPMVRMRSTPAVAAQFLEAHPEWFTLFATEHYKTTLAAPTDEWQVEHNRFEIEGFIADRFYYYSDHPETLTLSSDQFRSFVDNLVEYVAHDGYLASAQAAAHFINRYDPDCAANVLRMRLHDASSLTGNAEYTIPSLLACLDAAPATLSGDRCDYLGMTVALDGLPKGAADVERVSIYGDMVIIDADGNLVGHFSLHDLAPAEQHTFRALVSELELSDLFFQTEAEGDIPIAEQTALAAEFKTTYRRYAEHQFFQKSGIPLHTFPLKEQVGLIRLLKTGGEATQEAMLDEKSAFGKNVIRVHALASAYNYQDTLQIPKIDYTQRENFDYWGKAIEAVNQFIRFVQHAETTAGILHAELHRIYPDIELNAEDVTRGIVSDALYRLNTITDEASSEAYVERLGEQTRDVTLGFTYFREIIGLAEQDQIDLTDCLRRHQAILRLLENNPTLHGMLVDVLLQCDKLKPDKELIWRVDRPMSEYNRRTGMDVVGLARDLAEDYTEKQIFFETGAGNGNSMAERTRNLGDKYRNFAINDVVYYPLRPLLARCIDFDALALVAGETLSETDQAALVDYLYKVLYLVPGAGGEETIDLSAYYDQATIAAIAADPNTLQTLLPSLGEKLTAATAVPSEFNAVVQPDGTFLYPDKIRLADQSPAFRAAYQTFSEDPSHFLNQDMIQGDLKQHIPIFPVGMVLGDFSKIKRIKPGQVLAGVDVKALEKLDDKEYIQDLIDVGHTLKADKAAFTSESVRRDFGKSYRLRALVEVQRQLGAGYTLYITKGPGEPDEDYNATATVRGVVITRGDVPESILQARVASEQYSIHRLDEIVRDEAYVRSLDSDGSTWESLQAVA